MTHSAQLLETANRLRSAEFKPFVDWLVLERTAVLEHLTTAPPEHIGRLQGDAGRLKKIMDLIEGAQAALGRKAG